MIAHPVRTHVRPDRSDHTGKVDAQLRLAGVARVPTHRHQHIGEVQAGCGDRNLDLTRPGCRPGERGQFHGLQLAGRADLQPHAFAGVVDDGGVALLGSKWRRVQVSRVPLLVAERGFVLVRSEQQLLRDQLALGGIVDVDLGGMQGWMLGADYPEQAAQTGLLEVRTVTGHNSLGAARDDVESRHLASGLGKIANDPDQFANVLTGPLRKLLREAAGPRSGHHDHVPEATLCQIRLQPFGVGGVVGVLRPRHGRYVGVVELQRVSEFRGQDVGGVRHAHQQPRTGTDV